MIDFELDESQLELQAAARRVIAEAGGLGLARRMLESGEGYSQDLWHQMIALDWVGLVVPEEYGGSGGGLVDLFAIALETGRAAVASPLVASSVVASHVLAGAAPSNPSAAALLRDLAAGRATVVPAVVEASGVWDEAGVEATATPEGDGGVRLDGAKAIVPFADTATRMIVAAREESGVSLFLVDPTASGVSVTATANVAALPLHTVVLDHVRVGDADRLGGAGAGWALLGPALARGAVIRAAEIAGAGEAMLTMAVDYAQQRVQFGKPIGVHQAVQYLCTDIAIESHLTRKLALRAAWLLDTGQHADVAVGAAKLYASRASAHMAQQAHEVFAGVAFMMEHDLHLLTRAAKHWEHDFGDVRHHAEGIVGALERQLLG